MEATDSRRFSPPDKVAVGFGEAREIYLLKHAVGGLISPSWLCPIDLGPMDTSSRTKLAANWCSGSWNHADTAQQFLAFPVDRLTPGMRGLEVVGDEHLAGDRLE